jgi:hypothetical protein
MTENEACCYGRICHCHGCADGVCDQHQAPSIKTPQTTEASEYTTNPNAPPVLFHPAPCLHAPTAKQDTDGQSCHSLAGKSQIGSSLKIPHSQSSIDFLRHFIQEIGVFFLRSSTDRCCPIGESDDDVLVSDFCFLVLATMRDLRLASSALPS